MGFYRLTSKQYVDSFFEGKIYFGDLKRYRTLEESGDVTRGDRLETSVQNHITKVTQENSEEASKLLASQRFRFNVSDNAVVTNVTISLYSPGFALCFSHGDLRELWSKNAQNFGADSCVEILDPEALVLAIKEHGWVDPDSAILDHKVILDHGPVSYDAPEIHDVLASKTFETPNPFRKRAIYADQMEYRVIMMMAEKEVSATHAIMRIPPVVASTLFRRVDVSSL